MQTTQFLNLILPQSGIKQWWAKRGNDVRSGACSTVEQLAYILTELDRKGAEVYMACAGFKDGTNRRQDNVSAVRSFWLDIDVDNPQQQKDYRSVEEAWAALGAFCQRANLPFPTAVCSGYGIHCYWTLKNDIDPAVWRERAEKLQTLADQLGFKIDKKRTKDLASILRPVGTTNKKHGERPVYVLHTAEPLDDFNPGLIRAPANQDILQGIGSAKPDMQQGYSDGQRTDALTLRIGWLVGPQHLGFEDALQQIRQWNAHNRPPLDDAKLIHTLTSLHAAEQRKRTEKTQEVFQAPTKPELPQGFMWGAQMQLLAAIKDENGEPSFTVVSDFPIYLERITKHETNKEVTMVFKHRHPQEGWYEATITQSEMNGANWRAILSKTGPNINKWALKHFELYVGAAQNMLRNKMADQKQFDQFGPREDFTECVLGNRLYKADGSVLPADVAPALRQRANCFGPQRNASLAEWTFYADTLFANGCEAQGFTVLCSMAAPFIHLTSDTEGGVILSLISPETGQGKTTALEAAMSVWGNKYATSISENDTANAITKTSAILGYFPIICDEKKNQINDKDSKYAIQQVRIFTGGKDRDRLKRDGSPQDMGKTWHTVMIHASNRPFAEIANEANDEAMLARVLELTVDIPEHIRKNRIDTEVRKLLLKNGGVAGDALIRYAMRPEVMSTIRAQVPLVMERLRVRIHNRAPQLSAEVRYLLRLVAVVAVVGKMALKLELLHFDLDRIIEHVLDKIIDRSQDQKLIGTNNPISQLAHIIECNMADAIIVDRQWIRGKICVVRKRPMRNGIHLRIEESSRKCYMSARAFRTYCRQLNVQSSTWLIKELRKKGVIEDGTSSMMLGAGTEYKSIPSSCYVIDMAHPELPDILKFLDPVTSTIDAVDHVQ